MEEKLKLIEQNCGTKPVNEELIEIGSDPNFVFLNDPNFPTLRLFDIENNVINVNSWIECAHYVSGGWSRNPSTNFTGDEIYLILVIGFTIAYSIMKFSIRRFIKNEN